MAQFTLKIPTRTTSSLEFTPDTDIMINSIHNDGALPLNFSEGETIVAGTNLKAIGSAGAYLSLIDVIVDYTEL